MNENEDVVEKAEKTAENEVTEAKDTKAANAGGPHGSETEVLDDQLKKEKEKKEKSRMSWLQILSRIWRRNNSDKLQAVSPKKVAELSGYWLEKVRNNEMSEEEADFAIRERFPQEFGEVKELHGEEKDEAKSAWDEEVKKGNYTDEEADAALEKGLIPKKIKDAVLEMEEDAREYEIEQQLAAETIKQEEPASDEEKEESQEPAAEYTSEETLKWIDQYKSDDSIPIEIKRENYLSRMSDEGRISTEQLMEYSVLGTVPDEAAFLSMLTPRQKESYGSSSISTDSAAEDDIQDLIPDPEQIKKGNKGEEDSFIDDLRYQKTEDSLRRFIEEKLTRRAESIARRRARYEGGGGAYELTQELEEIIDRELLTPLNKENVGEVRKRAEQLVSNMYGMLTDFEQHHAEELARELNSDISDEEQEELSTEEVNENAALSNIERLDKASEILREINGGNVSFTPEQEAAILKAHGIGRGEKGKSGGEAGIGNYAFSQLREKAQILEDEGQFTQAERRALMESGIVGDPTLLEQLDELEKDKTLDRYERDKKAHEIAANALKEGLDKLTTREELSGFLENKAIAYFNNAVDSLGRNEPDNEIDKIRKISYRDQINEMKGKVANASEEDLDKIIREVKGQIKGYIDQLRDKLKEFEDKEKVRYEEDQAKRKKQDTEATLKAEADALKFEKLKKEQERKQVEREKKSEEKQKGFEDMVAVAKGIMLANAKFATVEFAREHSITDSDVGSFPLLSHEKDGMRVLRYKPKSTEDEDDKKEKIDVVFYEKKVNGTYSYYISESEGKYISIDDYLKGKPDRRTENIRSFKGKLHEGSEVAIEKGGDFEEVDVVDRANFQRWVRDRMEYLHNDTPDDPIGFGEKISVETHTGSYRYEVNLARMLQSESKYFKDGDGEVLKSYREEITRLLWVTGMVRNMHTTLLKGDNLSNDEGIAKVLTQLFESDIFAKEYKGKNTFEFLLTLDAKYGSGDMKVGRAIGSALMIYYNFTDAEELDKLFNKGGDFKFYRRDVMWEALRQSAPEEYADVKENKRVLNTYDIWKYAQKAEIKLGGRYVDQLPTEEQKKKLNDPGATEDEKRDIYKLLEPKFEPGYYKSKDEFVHVSDPAWITRHSWYSEGKDGKVRRDTFIESGKEVRFIDDFLRTLNIFDPPQKNGRTINTSRSLVNLTCGMKSGLLGDVTESDAYKKSAAHKSEYDSSNANFAELWGFFLTYIGGAASNQDIRATAYNAMTKTDKSMLYFLKQQNPKDRSRAGAVGNPRLVGIEKMFTSNFLTGLLMEDKRSTIYKIMEEMETREQELKEEKKSNSNITDEVIAKELQQITTDKLRIPRRSFRQFPSQHYGNGSKRFQNRVGGNEIRLDKFAKRDIVGRITYDHSQMIKEVQENIIKPTRYSLSTWRRDYAQIERELVDNTGAIPTWKTVTLAEKQFSPQHLQMTEKIYLKDKARAGKPGHHFLDKDGKVMRNPDGSLNASAEAALRDADWAVAATRASILMEFSAMVYNHTTRNSDYEYIDISTRETIIRALGRIPAGMEVDPNDFRNTIVNARYLDAEEIKWLRELSDNTFRKNMTRQVGLAFGKGTGLGLLKGLKGYLKQFFPGI